jgi:hypothetical protein
VIFSLTNIWGFGLGAIEIRFRWDLFVPNCHDPNLGLAIKANAWKGAGWKCNLGVTFAFLKVW